MEGPRSAKAPFVFPANGQILTTKLATLLEERAMENHHHDNQVVLWTQTQRAFVEPQANATQHDYGHGFYVLLATPLVADIRLPDFQTSTPHLVVQTLIQDLRASELTERLLPTQDDAHERERLIEDGFAVDLPSGSVRAIIARLENIERSAHLANTKLYRRACLRVLKAIRCGVQTLVFKTNPEGQQVPVFHDVVMCKQHFCTRPLCHAHIHKAKERLATRTMSQMTGHGTKVMFIIKHHHPLPKEEVKNPRHPCLDLRGRGRPAHLRPTKPNTTPSRGKKTIKASLLAANVKRHITGRTKLLHNPKTRHLLGDASAYFGEVSWLVPKTPGYRCFPFPHTHVITSILSDPEETRQQLQSLLRKYNPAAEVLVSELQTTRASSLHGRVPASASASASGSYAALSSYLGKTHTVTPDDKNPEFYDAALKAHDVVNVIDDRSLAEVIDFYDFHPTRMTAAFNTRKPVASTSPSVTAFNPWALRAWRSKRPSKDGLLDQAILKLRDRDKSDGPGARGLGLGRKTSPLVGMVCEAELRGEVGVLVVRSGPDASDGGVDHGSRTEARQVGDVSLVAQPWVVPTCGLLNQKACDAWLAKVDHRNHDGKLVTSDSQAHASQETDPGLWMEEDDDNLIATSQNMTLLDEHLIHDLLRASQQGDRARELKGLRVFVEADDDLDGIDFIEVLGVDTEGSLASALVAGAQGRVGSGGDGGSETVRCEGEQVLAVVAAKPDAEVGGDAQRAGEGGREGEQRRCWRTQRDGNSGVACSSVEKDGVQQGLRGGTEHDLPVDLEYEESTIVERSVKQLEREGDGWVPWLGDLGQHVVAPVELGHGLIGAGLFDGQRHLVVQQGEGDQWMTQDAGGKGDGHCRGEPSTSSSH